MDIKSFCTLLITALSRQFTKFQYAYIIYMYIHIIYIYIYNLALDKLESVGIYYRNALKVPNYFTWEKGYILPICQSIYLIMLLKVMIWAKVQTLNHHRQKEILLQVNFVIWHIKWTMLIFLRVKLSCLQIYFFNEKFNF